MKFRRILNSVLLASAFLTAAPTWSQAPDAAAAAAPSTAQVNPAPQSRAIRILTPVAGQTLSSNFADVRYQVIAPNPANVTNFVVQLDHGDPINTSDTEYTFTGLQPGRHTVTVSMVDANGTPMPGSLAAVQFAVPAPGQSTPQSTTPNAPPRTNPSPRGPAAPDVSNEPVVPVDQAAQSNPQQALPAASSALPLLSIIGFGALLGGALSAMRSKRH